MPQTPARSLGWLFAFFAGCALSAPAFTIAAEPAEVAQWLRELDHAEYAVREAALERLVAVGAPAIEPLTRHVLSDSPEVAWRATVALERIAVRGDEKTLLRVGAALSQLSAQGKPGLVRLVGEIQARQKVYRKTRAIAAVRAAGGQIAGDSVDAEADLAFAVDGPVAVAAAEIEVVAEAAPVAPAIAEIELAPAPPAEAEPAPPAEKKIGAIELLVRAFFRGGDKDDAPADAPVSEEPFERLPERDELDRPDFSPLPARVVEDIEIIDAAPVIALDDFGPEVGVLGGEIFVGGVEVEGEEAPEEMLELTLGPRWKGGDQSLAALADLPTVYTINIQGAKLTDAALMHFAKLPKLDHINLQKTPFSAAALRKLRAAQPELSIFARGEAMLGVNADLDGPCVINSVFRGSGAHEAGLKDGDEIVEVDGAQVADFSDLTIAIYPHQGGDQVAVKYKRDGKLAATTVKLKPRVAVEAQARP